MNGTPAKERQRSAGDPLGVFVPHGPATMAAEETGPLSGYTMAAKDLFDIAGYRTGFGNPTWLDSHEPAEHTASAVARLLEAGAAFKGKTICDELCFSLNGENMHYGTPQNVNAPGRIPGGSSSGSAAAVAGGIVDFALGSDTGGSLRLPASYCGVYGFRTTHGRIACDGVTPLAASFDVVGWLARDADLMQRVGEVLFPKPVPATPARQLLILDDAFDIAGPVVAKALAPAIQHLKDVIGADQHIGLGTERMQQWADDFRLLQGAEIWATHGNWIEREQPLLDPAIAARLKWTSTLVREDLAPAKSRQSDWKNEAASLLAPGHVICLPVAPGAAPLLNQAAAALEQHRQSLIPLLCLAGLAGLPQLSLPLATIEDCPLGLGLIAGAGDDESLLALASQLVR